MLSIVLYKGGTFAQKTKVVHGRKTPCLRPDLGGRSRPRNHCSLLTLFVIRNRNPDSIPQSHFRHIPQDLLRSGVVEPARGYTIPKVLHVEGKQFLPRDLGDRVADPDHDFRDPNRDLGDFWRWFRCCCGCRGIAVVFAVVRCVDPGEEVFERNGLRVRDEERPARCGLGGLCRRRRAGVGDGDIEEVCGGQAMRSG